MPLLCVLPHDCAALQHCLACFAFVQDLQAQGGKNQEQQQQTKALKRYHATALSVTPCRWQTRIQFLRSRGVMTRRLAQRQACDPGM